MLQAAVVGGRSTDASVCCMQPLDADPPNDDHVTCCLPWQARVAVVPCYVAKEIVLQVAPVRHPDPEQHPGPL
jgi:hypothetical protein